ncbi:MAG: hypothetical protein AB1540_11610 [Bdellovibrionota bacterium]
MYNATSSTPLKTVEVTTVAGQGFVMGSGNRVPIPSTAAADPQADASMLIVDRSRNLSWDFYQAQQLNSETWRCNVCATTDLAGSGVRPPTGDRPDWYLSHGARACGFPLIAGLIRADEIRAGRIDHALVLAYPGIRSRYFKPPASTAQATFPAISPTEGIPCGGRIQLDPSINVDTLPLSRSGKIIARALQEYGAYVGDYSGSLSFYADGSDEAIAYWNSGVLNSSDLHGINPRWFRVLPIGSLYNNNN